MSCGTAILFKSLVIICALAVTSTATSSLRCYEEGATCQSLTGYQSKNRTNLGAIQRLFGVTRVVDILGANGLPDSILPGEYTVEEDQVIRIPLECKCDHLGMAGRVQNLPVYTIQTGDDLDHIAAEVFSGLVTSLDIVNANDIRWIRRKVVEGPDRLLATQDVVVPLPCSCGRMNGTGMVHLGLVRKYGTVLGEYGTPLQTILSANGVANATQLLIGQVLDIPLTACSSMVRNDSLDYPLLVPNGSYVYTANGCVRCNCNAAKNWTLLCEPSKLKPTNWSTCPSMQCNNSSNINIGSTISSSSHNHTICAYAGYGSRTIFTTLVTVSIPPDNSRRGKEDDSMDNKSRWWIWLIVAGGVIVVPLFCYFCCVIWTKCKIEADRKKQQKKLIREIGGSTVASAVHHRTKRHSKDGKTNHEMQIFSFTSIATATDNFSVANKLGEGGFGPVYKGELPDGQEIAIKRLSSRSGQGLVEFKNEAKLIAKLQHTNLVRLLGFCIQNEERILIYEYMPNKSLDFHLFDSNERRSIVWEKRFSIIGGIAHGLVYLHHFSRLKVIHRDLKASNILLDYEMNPKISDFGMARIFELKGIEENTKRIVGTYGYMSPEYAMNGIVSVKTDVFSFGVLLLEIVSGKKNNSRYHSDYPLNLTGFAWQLWNEGRGVELIDSLLLESCQTAEALRCIQLGLLCVQDRAADRPSMLEVVSMLSNETIVLPAPKQPAYFIDVVANETNVPVGKQETCSINEVTISEMDAR